MDLLRRRVSLGVWVLWLRHQSRSSKRMRPSPVIPPSSSRFLLGGGLGASMKGWIWGTKEEDDKDKKEKKEPEEIVLNPRHKVYSPKPPLRLKDESIAPSIRKADELYENAFYPEAYSLLSPHSPKLEPEVLWRLARLTYEKTKVTQGEERKAFVEEAFRLASLAVTLDEGVAGGHRWLAILLNERATYAGIKAQIQASVLVRSHMETASDLNPKDPTAHYLLGHWCYTVADIPWYQKQVASALFATPPSCTFQEAYRSFLEAELLEPGFYSMNLLLLGKSCLKLGEREKAAEYLLQLHAFKARTTDDFEAKKEAAHLLENVLKVKMSRRPF